MDAALKQSVTEIIETGKDFTIATLREDGWPQATTVSYASEGLAIYFGCDGYSQKARNLTRDDRVSGTINLPYGPWGEIRGLSIGGRARRLTDAEKMGHVGALFLKKFAPEISEFITADGQDLAMFEIIPTVISVLDYRQGFGHTDLIETPELAAELAATAAA